MKKILLISLTLCFTLAPRAVCAHVGGVPILKIDGKLTKAYFNSSFTSSVFDLPYNIDKAPEHYIVKKPLDFEIDTTTLPIPEDYIQDLDFIWDFGDGTGEQKIKQGIKNSHTYTKTGTYVVNVMLDASSLDPNLGLQQGQTVLINILPSNDYQLPKAVVKVNGQEVPENSTKSLSLDLNNRITFDALDSKQGSANIVEYRWDFGQGGKEGRNKITSYRFKLPQYFATVILRVKDENGYYSDFDVQLTNSGKNEKNNPEAEDIIKFVFIIGGAIVFTTIFGIVGTLLFKKQCP